MYQCEMCNYFTDKHNNLIRHQNSKKHMALVAVKNHSQTEKNNSQTEKNHSQTEKNHSQMEKNHSQTEKKHSQAENNYIKYECFKCAKIYKCFKSFEQHEKICKGIDIMTCPRCMTTFKHQSSKAKHIGKGKCKPRSIFEYLKEKDDRIQQQTFNIDTQQNATTINNQTLNTTNNNNNINNNTNINNNIFINDFGKERKDYFSDERILKIIEYCDNNIIPKYITYKHFNPDYPENKNIQFKNNIYLIKSDGNWNNIDGDVLAKELYNKNKYEIGKYCYENEDQIEMHLQNEDKFEKLKEKTDFNNIELKGEDKEIKKKIKSVIKSQQMKN